MRREMRSVVARSPHGGRAERRRQARLYPPWLLWPAFSILALFFFLPNALNFVYAFTNWSAFKRSIDFVGFQQFVAISGDSLLLNDIRATVVFAALVALFQNVFGLGLALLLEKDTAINRVARAFFFLPVLMSALAVGYVFQALLRPDGALNQMLGLLTGQDVSTAWLGSTTWTIIVVALI